VYFDKKNEAKKVIGEAWSKVSEICIMNMTQKDGVNGYIIVR